jgi:hypothetical protein
MGRPRRAFLVAVSIRAFGTLLLGLAGWAGIGLLATVPLGSIYGWSGHPAIPDAPIVV